MPPLPIPMSPLPEVEPFFISPWAAASAASGLVEHRVTLAAELALEDGDFGFVHWVGSFGMNIV